MQNYIISCVKILCAIYSSIFIFISLLSMFQLDFGNILSHCKFNPLCMQIVWTLQSKNILLFGRVIRIMSLWDKFIYVLNTSNALVLLYHQEIILIILIPMLLEQMKPIIMYMLYSISYLFPSWIITSLWSTEDLSVPPPLELDDSFNGQYPSHEKGVHPATNKTLIFDSTFGVIPKEFKEQWDEEVTTRLKHKEEIISQHKKTRLPPVRFSVGEDTVTTTSTKPTKTKHSGHKTSPYGI